MEPKPGEKDFPATRTPWRDGAERRLIVRENMSMTSLARLRLDACVAKVRSGARSTTTPLPSNTAGSTERRAGWRPLSIDLHRAAGQGRCGTDAPDRTKHQTCAAMVVACRPPGGPIPTRTGRHPDNSARPSFRVKIVLADDDIRRGAGDDIAALGELDRGRGEVAHRSPTRRSRRG